MARGSTSNVTESRTRSKRGTPTQEIEEKQITDSNDKKVATTRRRNINVSTAKVEKNVNKKANNLETDNSGETSSVSNENLESSTVNELVGKKETLKNKQQNKGSKTFGRKRAVENTVDESTEEAVKEVDEIVGKRAVRGCNKRLKAGAVDDSTQAKDFSNRKGKNTREGDEILEEQDAEEQDVNRDIKFYEVELKMERIDDAITLDDSSQVSSKSATARKTRTVKELEEDIIEQKDTKDLKTKEIWSQEENDADTADNNSQDSIKVVRRSTGRKTRSAKKVDEHLNVEQKEAKVVEADTKINLDKNSVKVGLIDDSSQDSLKLSRSVPTRRTRSAKKVEENVEVYNDKDLDLEQSNTVENMDDLVDKEDEVLEDNSNDSITLSDRVLTRKVRNILKVQESITAENKDAKAIEVKDQCNDNDISQDSVKLIKGGSTRKTRSAKKLKVDTSIKLKDIKAKDENESDVETEVVDDSSQDSMKSNQSGSRITRNVKKTREKLVQKDTSFMEIEEKSENMKDYLVDDISHNSNDSDLIKKTSNTKKAEDFDSEKQTLSDNDSRDSLKTNDKGTTRKGTSVKNFTENILTENVEEDNVSEQISSKKVEIEDGMKQTVKEIEANNADESSQDSLKLIKDSNMKSMNAKGSNENIPVEHKGEDKSLDDAEYINMNIEEKIDYSEKELKSVNVTTEFGHTDSKNSKLESKMDQYEIDMETGTSDDKSEVDVDSKDRNVFAGEINKNNLEVQGTTENLELFTSNEDGHTMVMSGKMTEVRDDDGSSKIQKKIALCELDQTSLPKNVEETVRIEDKELNPEKFDQSECENIEIFKSNEIAKSEIPSTFENVLIQESENSVENLDSMSGEINLTEDNKSTTEGLEIETGKIANHEQANLHLRNKGVSNKHVEEMFSVDNVEQCNIKETSSGGDSKTVDNEVELKDSKVSQSRMEVFTTTYSKMDVFENIDLGETITGIMGKTSEKTKVDIDICSDKTEEASVTNFESESSMTDSDTGNLVITDSVESTNIEMESSEKLDDTKHLTKDSFDDKKQKDITIKMIDSGEKPEINVTSCEFRAEEMSTISVNSESPIKCITGNNVENTTFGINSLNDASLDNSVDDVKSACEVETDVKQISDNSMSDGTLGGEPKMAPEIESSPDQTSESVIQMPLTISNAAGTCKDSENILCQMTKSSSSSSDKIIIDSSHSNVNFDINEKENTKKRNQSELSVMEVEKSNIDFSEYKSNSDADDQQKAKKRKKSRWSVVEKDEPNKTSVDVNDVERNEAGRRIITTYEVSSNVDSTKGVKRSSSLTNEEKSGSGSEVSLALKIKRKRVEEVESQVVAHSSHVEHAASTVSNESNIGERIQQLATDCHPTAGPSGTQQETKRSTRRRKGVESEKEQHGNPAAPIRMYLERFVPFLLEGLLKITYVRPDDPIQYLADWMKENKEAAYSSMNSGDNDDLSSD